MLDVNFFSAYVAAHEAVKGFATLQDSTKKTFIFTGNKLNLIPIPQVLGFGTSKSASAHMMMSAAAAYGEKEYQKRFK